MKIGIVTVHDSNNYGSFLQAYALQCVLQQMGHEVYFAVTRDKKFVKKIFVPALLQKKLFRHPFSLLRSRKNGRIKRKAFLNDQKYFEEIEKEDLSKMDLVILGSDEIWNVQVKSFRNKIFYGSDLTNVLAYGVSVGRAGREDFVKYPEIISCIRNIHCVLARDNRTKEIVKEITGVSPDIVCDPTFLVDRSVFSRKDTVPVKKAAEEYVLIYSYGIGEELEKKIKDFAEENRLKIVSACFYYKWADYNIMCGPMDFCSIIKGADCVITTTFHGTIFSVLNQKQFISIPASIKTNDLLEQIGLAERIVGEKAGVDVIQGLLKQDIIDYIEVNKRISDMRSKSLQLLTKGIDLTVMKND